MTPRRGGAWAEPSRPGGRGARSDWIRRRRGCSRTRPMEPAGFEPATSCLQSHSGPPRSAPVCDGVAARPRGTGVSRPWPGLNGCRLLRAVASTRASARREVGRVAMFEMSVDRASRRGATKPPALDQSADFATKQAGRHPEVADGLVRGIRAGRTPRVGRNARCRDRSRRALGALAACPSDGLGGCAYAEFGFQSCEPLPDGVKAEEQLAGDGRLVLHRRSSAQHFGFARGQAEAIEGVGAEACDLLFQQQRVRVAGQQADSEAPAVAHAGQRRARGERQPRGDRPR